MGRKRHKLADELFGSRPRGAAPDQPTPHRRESPEGRGIAWRNAEPLGLAHIAEARKAPGQASGETEKSGGRSLRRTHGQDTPPEPPVWAGLKLTVLPTVMPGEVPQCTLVCVTELAPEMLHDMV